MPRPALTAALAASPAAGCGADRIAPPDIERPFTVEGPAERKFPAAGVAFQAPADWRFDTGPAPLVATTSSGSATIAIWRYPRSEPLPQDEIAIDQADGAFQQGVRARDERFRVQRSRRVRVDGARGFEVLGIGQVAGRERQIRSTHVFAKGAEYVIDTYAATRGVALIDRTVFRPLVRSFKIGPPRS